MMKKNDIQTRRNEVKMKTSDPIEMRGKFTCDRVMRRWTEDFVDEESGEVVSIERAEVLFDRGIFIDQDVLSKMMFYLQSGDIKHVEVSNQRRTGYCDESRHLRLCFATVSLSNTGKNIRILFYASRLEDAIEVLTDYVELNYQGGFSILSIKYFGAGFVLEDRIEEGKNVSPELNFYHIDFVVEIDGEEAWRGDAVVYTFSVDRAMVLINDYLIKKERAPTEGGLKGDTLFARVEEAKRLSVSEYIPRDFSMAYIEDGWA